MLITNTKIHQPFDMVSGDRPIMTSKMAVRLGKRRTKSSKIKKMKKEKEHDEYIWEYMDQ